MELNLEKFTVSHVSKPAELRLQQEFGDRRGHNSRYEIDPFRGFYYDTEDEVVGSISTSQIISTDCSVVEAIGLLRSHPFLVTVFRPTNGYLSLDPSERTRREEGAIMGPTNFERVIDDVELKSLKNSEFTENHGYFVQNTSWTSRQVGLRPEEFGRAHPEYRRQIIEIERSGVPRWSIIEWWMLNHKQTKLALYSAISELEEQTGDLLRHLFRDSEEIIEETGEVPEHVQDDWDNAGKPGTHGVIEFLYFSHICNILERSPQVLEVVDMDDQRLSNRVQHLNDIRIKVMHPVNTLIESEEDLSTLSQTISDIQALLSAFPDLNSATSM